MTKSKKPTVALILGGGAPNATLMAGALVAFIEAGVEFEIISTSGAGAIVGLLYAVPKQGTAIEMLKKLPGLGIADPIYQGLPINYKVFNKPGVLADNWRNLLAANPFYQQVINQENPTPTQRLFSDWLQLVTATLCPTNLTPLSSGLCAHVPFIDEIVNFSALADITPQFYLNAYNLTQHEMACWNKKEITHDHFLAALSFPFIYPPYQLDSDFFIEGASIDTLNFKRLFQDHPYIDTTVVFDVLGQSKILHPPKNLYDSWVQSIITPLTEIARDDLKLFEALHNKDASGKPRTKLLRVNYEHYLTQHDYESELDWSYTNLDNMYEIGYKAGKEFTQNYASDLGIN